MASPGRKMQCFDPCANFELRLRAVAGPRPGHGGCARLGKTLSEPRPHMAPSQTCGSLKLLQVGLIDQLGSYLPLSHETHSSLCSRETARMRLISETLPLACPIRLEAIQQPCKIETFGLAANENP